MPDAVPPRLSIVTLGTRDLPRLRRFYKDLGWDDLPESTDSWAAFMLSGVVLALFPVDDLAAEAAPGEPVPASAGGWTGTTLALNVETAADVDRVFAAAVERGATAVAEPVDRPWGGRSGYIAVPDGNRWEIAWAPTAVFDVRGALTSFGADE